MARSGKTLTQPTMRRICSPSSPLCRYCVSSEVSDRRRDRRFARRECRRRPQPAGHVVGEGRERGRGGAGEVGTSPRRRIGGIAGRLGTCPPHALRRRANPSNVSRGARMRRSDGIVLDDLHLSGLVRDRHRARRSGGGWLHRNRERVRAGCRVHERAGSGIGRRHARQVR
jgi:hypothetical protein